jgi:transglutaminase-like putative cysteine protease
MNPVRRTFLKGSAAVGALLGTPSLVLAANPFPAHPMRFSPEPGEWRTFDVTTRVALAHPMGESRVWVPVPSIESDWQRTVGHSFQSNGQARLAADGIEGTRFVAAEFAADVKPVLEVTSRVQTRSRHADLNRPGKSFAREDAASLHHYTRATALLPTDGIVRSTALKATQGAHTDVQKVHAIYNWVVANAWREPKVRGCGEGNIRTMLETGNLGGKCADINALFVGLCRAAGVPARDVYGLRLAPSAFGYKQLSGNPANLSGAQHCRAEVYLQAHGWVAMDPADVTKVMRHETADWIKTTEHPVVAPVFKGLFGGWEGNWVGWNTAHDLKLPSAKEGVLNFLMYPVAETAEGRVDSYTPAEMGYSIRAVEVTA